MGDSHTDLVRALEALAGREPWPADLSPGLRAQATRLLERVRAVGLEPAVPKRAAARALKVFRSSRKPASGASTLLRLVFDSWFEPAPALRAVGSVATRFLRFDGVVRVELQIRETPRGVELFGQVDPPASASTVQLEFEGKQRRTAIDAVGSFRFARLRHGAARLRIGDLTVEDVPL